MSSLFLGRNRMEPWIETSVITAMTTTFAATPMTTTITPPPPTTTTTQQRPALPRCVMGQVIGLEYYSSFRTSGKNNKNDDDDKVLLLRVSDGQYWIWAIFSQQQQQEQQPCQNLKGIKGCMIRIIDWIVSTKKQSCCYCRSSAIFNENQQQEQGLLVNDNNDDDDDDDDDDDMDDGLCLQIHGSLDILGARGLATVGNPRHVQEGSTRVKQWLQHLEYDWKGRIQSQLRQFSSSESPSPPPPPPTTREGRFCRSTPLEEEEGDVSQALKNPRLLQSIFQQAHKVKQAFQHHCHQETTGATKINNNSNNNNNNKTITTNTADTGLTLSQGAADATVATAAAFTKTSQSQEQSPLVQAAVAAKKQYAYEELDVDEAAEDEDEDEDEELGIDAMLIPNPAAGAGDNHNDDGDDDDHPLLETQQQQIPLSLTISPLETQPIVLVKEQQVKKATTARTRTPPSPPRTRSTAAVDEAEEEEDTQQELLDTQPIPLFVEDDTTMTTLAKTKIMMMGEAPSARHKCNHWREADLEEEQETLMMTAAGAGAGAGAALAQELMVGAGAGAGAVGLAKDNGDEEDIFEQTGADAAASGTTSPPPTPLDTQPIILLDTGDDQDIISAKQDEAAREACLCGAGGSRGQRRQLLPTNPMAPLQGATRRNDWNSTVIALGTLPCRRCGRQAEVATLLNSPLPPNSEEEPRTHLPQQSSLSLVMLSSLDQPAPENGLDLETTWSHNKNKRKSPGAAPTSPSCGTSTTATTRQHGNKDSSPATGTTNTTTNVEEYEDWSCWKNHPNSLIEKLMTLHTDKVMLTPRPPSTLASPPNGKDNAPGHCTNGKNHQTVSPISVLAGSCILELVYAKSVADG